MVRCNVSICMAVYNGGLFLQWQLDSIISQLLQYDEIVVVDDGSSDDSRKIISRYAEMDPRVRVSFNERNIGIVKTFEKALSLAKNDVIFLSDQDDVWLMGKIDNAVRKLNSGSVSAILTNSEIFVEDSKTGRLFFDNGYVPRLSIMSQFYKNDFIGCCMCFKRSILVTALPFPGAISMHDWWLGINALKHGQVLFDALPSILYRRHQRNASPSSRRSLWKIFKSRIFNLIAICKLSMRYWRLRLF